MANIIIAGGQISDAATISGDTVASNYPLSNLLTIQPGEKARFSSPTAPYVVLDLGSAQAITFAALLAHNGSGSGTWRVRGATSEANLTASPGYDSGSGSLWPGTGKPDADVFHSFLSFASQSFRWWRVDVADASNTDGYFEAGRVLLASAWQPSVNYSFGAGIGWIDPSEVDQGAEGHLFPTRRQRHRVFTLPFRFQTESDLLTGIYELQRDLGAGRDVFCVLDPDDTTHLHRRSVHGLMLGTSAPLVLDTYQRYSTSLRIEELLP